MNLLWSIRHHTKTVLYKIQPQNKCSTHDLKHGKQPQTLTVATHIPRRPAQYHPQTIKYGYHLWCRIQVHGTRVS